MVQLKPGRIRYDILRFSGIIETRLTSVLDIIIIHVLGLLDSEHFAY